ncbi:MAG: bifunctional indole-3-glycerol phosphate synthase/phosphoribosylanthranilate isomerase [Spirochaetales bacterium]|nr:bifunctional indole-3-glycerol phosphate synthase/phosphoribosylanthranilate isomerase [Spirochaetales bacterium]
MMETPDILLKIAKQRQTRIHQNGAAQGLSLPSQRDVPVVPFSTHNGSTNSIIIAEVKRRSPSAGAIAAELEPVSLARQYHDAGFHRVSVLTEQDHFGGSLADLREVKTAHPNLAVLRKDFLLHEEDVDVSWRAGADAILLIAALLEPSVLMLMHRRAEALGLECLVEVHNVQEVERIRALKPSLVGINSRDLRTFAVDPLSPLETRAAIDWPCSVVYESGLSEATDVQFVRGSGFDGFLAGEALARDPDQASVFAKTWLKQGEAQKQYGIWKRLYDQCMPQRPLVKICGLTSVHDAQMALHHGADLLGFVLAESPRRVSLDALRDCRNLPGIKTGVISLKANEPMPSYVEELLDDGVLDWIQFHGSEAPSLVRSYPGYKAIRPRTVVGVEAMDAAGSPGVLVDAFHPELAGGTGRQVDAELLDAVAQRRQPWIAGGLHSENVAAIVNRWKPGLVDVSSGVESQPGKKNEDAVKQFILHAHQGYDISVVSEEKR